MRRSISALAAVLSFLPSIGAADSDAFSVAKTCLRVSQMIADYGGVALQLKENRNLLAFETEYRPSLQLFRIVAGDHSNAVLFGETKNWTAFQSSVMDCFGNDSCDVQGFAAEARNLSEKLLVACRLDYVTTRP